MEGASNKAKMSMLNSPLAYFMAIDPTLFLLLTYRIGN